MRNWLLDISLAVLMMMSVCILASVLFSSKQQTPTEPTETTVTTPVVRQSIGVLLDGEVEEILLEDYLVGVLLGELPADFHEEAKKAQAVVARTYALRVSTLGHKHGVGVVCGSPDCCQNYISAEEYVEKWGTEEPVESARKAVRETEGVVVTYEGSLIDATYFSSSGGKTESALAVWGTDVPYLQSVESPGEEGSGTYIETLRFSRQEFCSKLGVSLSGDTASWFEAVNYTDSGSVNTMRIGGKLYTGKQLRERLGLRSTVFTVATVSEAVLITCRGFGHRVGMSQYGADAMAKAGSDYIAIIKHYYSGVEVGK